MLSQRVHQQARHHTQPIKAPNHAAQWAHVCKWQAGLTKRCKTCQRESVRTAEMSQPCKTHYPGRVRQRQLSRLQCKDGAATT